LCANNQVIPKLTHQLRADHMLSNDDIQPLEEFLKEIPVRVPLYDPETEQIPITGTANMKNGIKQGLIVAVIGSLEVGKSTLINALLDKKICATTLTQVSTSFSCLEDGLESEKIAAEVRSYSVKELGEYRLCVQRVTIAPPRSMVSRRHRRYRGSVMAARSGGSD
jgi:hypothetical protein